MQSERSKLLRELGQLQARASAAESAAAVDAQRQEQSVQDTAAVVQLRVTQLEAELAKRDRTIGDLQAQLAATVRAAADTRQQLDALNRHRVRTLVMFVYLVADRLLQASLESVGGDAGSAEVRLLQKRVADLLRDKAALEQQIKAVRVSVGELVVQGYPSCRSMTSAQVCVQANRTPSWCGRTIG